MDNYFENKKRQSLVFTTNNIDSSMPYISMDPHPTTLRTIEMPGVVSFWSHLSGRYRTQKEQRDYIHGGLIDYKLPPIVLSETE